MMLASILSGILASANLGVGDAAPDFSVKDLDGNSHALADMVKKGPVILAFFPKAFTPG
jgi:peroxiredoxin Q/BCP